MRVIMTFNALHDIASAAAQSLAEVERLVCSHEVLCDVPLDIVWEVGESVGVGVGCDDRLLAYLLCSAAAGSCFPPAKLSKQSCACIPRSSHEASQACWLSETCYSQ
jgi:hypothetical protein